MGQKFKFPQIWAIWAYITLKMGRAISAQKYCWLHYNRTDNHFITHFHLHPSSSMFSRIWSLKQIWRAECRCTSNSSALQKNGEQGGRFYSCEDGDTSNGSWKGNSSSAAKDGVIRRFILQISGIDHCEVPWKCPKSRWAIVSLQFTRERIRSKPLYCDLYNDVIGSRSVCEATIRVLGYLRLKMNVTLGDWIGVDWGAAKFTLKFLVSSLIFWIFRETWGTKSEAEGGGRWIG